MYILSWSRQGSLMPSKAMDQNGVLVIPNVQASDAGTYVCMGSDMKNMDEATAILLIREGNAAVYITSNVVLLIDAPKLNNIQDWNNKIKLFQVINYISMLTFVLDYIHCKLISLHCFVDVCLSLSLTVFI